MSMGGAMLKSGSEGDAYEEKREDELEDIRKLNESTIAAGKYVANKNLSASVVSQERMAIPPLAWSGEVLPGSVTTPAVVAPAVQPATQQVAQQAPQQQQVGLMSSPQPVIIKAPTVAAVSA